MYKYVLILGPHIKMHSRTIDYINFRGDSIVIGDGKRNISLAEIREKLYGKLYEGAVIDINCHGGIPALFNKHLLYFKVRGSEKPSILSSQLYNVLRKCAEEKPIIVRNDACFAGMSIDDSYLLSNNSLLVCYANRKYPSVALDWREDEDELNVAILLSRIRAGEFDASFILPDLKYNISGFEVAFVTNSMNPGGYKHFAIEFHFMYSSMAEYFGEFTYKFCELLALEVSDEAFGNIIEVASTETSEAPYLSPLDMICSKRDLLSFVDKTAFEFEQRDIKSALTFILQRFHDEYTCKKLDEIKNKMFFKHHSEILKYLYVKYPDLFRDEFEKLKSCKIFESAECFKNFIEYLGLGELLNSDEVVGSSDAVELVGEM